MVSSKVIQKRSLATSYKQPSTVESRLAQEAAILKLCSPSGTLSGNLSLSQLIAEDQNNSSMCLSLDDDISLSEVKLAIKLAKIKSSLGLDKINNKVIKLLPDSYVSKLNEIYNKFSRKVRSQPNGPIR